MKSFQSVRGTCQLCQGVLLLIVLVLSASGVGHAQNCSSPAAPIVAAATDVITEPTSLIIQDASVDIDITHAFIGDLQLTLISPITTSVTLFENLGGSADNLLLTFANVGDPLGVPSFTAGNAQTPQDPFALTDLNGENSAGDWTFDIVDTFATSGDGVLNTWCVSFSDIAPTLPPNALTCSSAPGSGSADLSWSNNGAYSQIEVLVDGVSTAIIPGTAMVASVAVPIGGDHVVCLEATATLPLPQICCTVNTDIPAIAGLNCAVVGDSVEASWSNSAPYTAVEVTLDGLLAATLAGNDIFFSSGSLGQGSHELCVRGVLGGGIAADVCCVATVVGAADLEVCSAPGSPLDSALPPAVDVIDVVDNIVLDDLQIRVDITHTFQGDLDIDVQSPAGTLMRMWNDDGGGNDNLEVIFDSNGVPYNSVNPNCAFCFMQPGPDPLALLNAVGETSQGSWTITVDDTLGGDTGTLDEWCVRGFLGGPPPEPEFLRADVNGDGSVVGLIDGLFTLNWAFNGGPTPPCLAAADANGDSAVIGLVDGLYVLNFAFAGGPAPVAPFPTCGADDAAVLTLGCDNPSCP